MADVLFQTSITNQKYVVTASGAPASTTIGYKIGDEGLGKDGTKWVCTVAGSPGTWLQVGSGSVGGAVNFTGPVATTTATALGTTGTITFDPTLGNLFTLTPTGAMTLNAGSQQAGQSIQIVVTTAGASSFVITFGTGFKTTGTLATGTGAGKVFTITFIGDGTNFNEQSRTTAM